MTFTVTLSAAVQGGLTVHYATSDGTAAAGRRLHDDGRHAELCRHGGRDADHHRARSARTRKVEADETFSVALSNLVLAEAGVHGHHGHGYGHGHDHQRRHGHAQRGRT